MNNTMWAEHLAQWQLFLDECLSSTDDSGEQVKIERQLQAIEQVRFGAVLNPKLLIEFIKPSNAPVAESECDNFFLNLNETQKKAVRSAMGTDDLSLIQGPPGTGKTQVIAEICLQMYRQNPNIRILVCSETHIAVNNLISRISAYNDTIRIIRIRDKEQSEDINEFSPESIINTYTEWLQQNCKIDDFIDIISESLSDFNDKTLEKALALSANLVGMTCNRVGAYAFESSREMFDVVIIDEVCKATLPEILIPLTVARKAVLVGDPKQLPPVFCSEEIDVIRSIDNCDLQKYMYIDDLFAHSKRTILLDTQYRMTNQIGNMIGKLFYEEQLKNGRDVDSEDDINWIDYVPSQIWPLAEKSNSKNPQLYNLDECKIIIDVLKKLNTTSSKRLSVAIITPYRYQAFTIKKYLQAQELSNLSVNIDSVDAFQGKECDVVIFSLTRTIGSFRFLADERRLNVALSRAKEKIIIIGNLNYSNKNKLLKTISESSKIYKHDLEFTL